MSASGGTTAIVAALAANLGIAVTKFAAFALTASSSMLAEGIHSLADSGNQVLLLVGGKRSKRDATPQHPFGYGRERYVYGFIVSIVLFSIGGLFALYEAYHKWHEPHGIDAWKWVPIVVLLAAIGMESFSFRTAIHESNEVRGGLSWVQFVRTAKAPELPGGAAGGPGRADRPGVRAVRRLDDADHRQRSLGRRGHRDDRPAAGRGGVRAGRGDEVAAARRGRDRRERARDRAALVGEGVDSVIHMKTLHLGPEELLVAAKIAVGATESASDVALAIDAAERRVREAVPIARVIYLEPDIRRP